MNSKVARQINIEEKVPRKKFFFEITPPAGQMMITKNTDGSILSEKPLPDKISGIFETIAPDYPKDRTGYEEIIKEKGGKNPFELIKRKFMDFCHEVMRGSKIDTSQIIKNLEDNIETSVKCAIYTLPRPDVLSDEILAYLFLISWGYMTDDYLEKLLELRPTLETEKKIREFRILLIDSMRNARVEEKARSYANDEIIKKSPIMELIIKGWVDHQIFCFTNLENFEKNQHFYLIEFDRWLQSIEWQRLSSTYTSKITYSNIRFYNTGGLLTLEFLLLCMNLAPTLEQRGQITFKAMRNGTAYYNGLLNDILGVQNDFECDATSQASYTLFWLRAGKSFTDAYAEVLDFANVNLIACEDAAIRLLKMYPDDKQMDMITKVYREFCDGSVYWYVLCSDRYGYIYGKTYIDDDKSTKIWENQKNP